MTQARVTRVLGYCPSPLDGTAYWRVASPFAHLRKVAADFDFTIVDKCDTNKLLAHDVLLLQRPFTGDHVAAAQTAKLLGRKIWCDWDDDILDVPVNNGRYFVYQRESFKQNVRALARMADVVTTTNEELAKRFRAAGARNVVKIPNALDPLLTLGAADEDKIAVRRVAWRGGDSHNQDLLSMGAAFPRVAADFEGEVLWHFVGFNPHWLLNAFPAQSVHVHEWIGDVITYLRFMAQLRPSILAVPLIDDAFNRAKSNISVIEAAWMGAVPVVPAWLEGCDLPGVFTYKNDGDFERALREAASVSETELQQRLGALRDAVSKDWTLDSVNLARVFVLKRLMSTSASVTTTTGGADESTTPVST